MSLSLARTWVNATVRQPAAKSNALRLLDQAASEGVEATLIVGPHFSANGRCYLCRWDGRELAVIELGTAQQRDWKIVSQGLLLKLEPRETMFPVISTMPLVALDCVQFGGATTHDGWSPLVGCCVAEKVQADFHQVISNCALRAAYFRPYLPRTVKAMWYANQSLFAGKETLQFRFPPLFSQRNPQTFRGAVVVFLQLYTAENWTTQASCRRISNLTHAMVTLR